MLSYNSKHAVLYSKRYTCLRLVLCVCVCVYVCVCVSMLAKQDRAGFQLDS